MTKRMLIDASHAEETRVVVLDGTRLEEFDLEAATRKPLKGNIYLAKVVRVEPSLQAAFVEYGGNRHGFLAFGEIHPDYYQIPVADRQRLIAMQEAEAREEAEAEEAAEAAAEAGIPAPAAPPARPALPEADDAPAMDAPEPTEQPPAPASAPVDGPVEAPVSAQATDYENPFLRRMEDAPPIDPDFGPHSSGAERAISARPVTEPESQPAAEAEVEADVETGEADDADDRAEAEAHDAAAEADDEDEEDAPPPETLGGEGAEASEGAEEMRAERRQPPSAARASASAVAGDAPGRPRARCSAYGRNGVGCAVAGKRSAARPATHSPSHGSPGSSRRSSTSTGASANCAPRMARTFTCFLLLLMVAKVIGTSTMRPAPLPAPWLATRSSM